MGLWPPSISPPLSERAGTPWMECPDPLSSRKTGRVENISTPVPCMWKSAPERCGENPKGDGEDRRRTGTNGTAGMPKAARKGQTTEGYAVRGRKGSVAEIKCRTSHLRLLSNYIPPQGVTFSQQPWPTVLLVLCRGKQGVGDGPGMSWASGGSEPTRPIPQPVAPRELWRRWKAPAAWIVLTLPLCCGFFVGISCPIACV